ncbi:MAG: hypothetical protein A2Z88_01810 [Omnitrophica WOR_2 bacterium GWA2_47_8]|nr:MAG: hypothetical protein A2Z88_01810 [Omnitrophica WOR_2 bacterium GWA2_47_8]
MQRRSLVTSVVLLCLLVVSVSPAFAAALGAEGSQGEVGTELHYFKYEEPDIMEEDGLMFGIYGKYTYRTHENTKIEKLEDVFSGGNTLNAFTAEGKFSFGQVDYTSNSTGSIDDISDYLFEVRGLAGYDVPAGADNLVTPYVGLGYRYWVDMLGGETSTTGHAGYDRESNYLYLPLGVNVGVPLQSGWSLGANVEFDVFLWGRQKSHLEDVSSSLNTLENDQNDGWGVRGSLTVKKEMEGIDLVAEPFIRYWSIEDSDIGTVTCGGTPCALGYEPKNRTIEAGVRLGAKF